MTSPVRPRRNPPGLDARLRELAAIKREKAQFREEMGVEQRRGRGRTGKVSLDEQEQRAQAAVDRLRAALRARGRD